MTLKNNVKKRDVLFVSIFLVLIVVIFVYDVQYERMSTVKYLEGLRDGFGDEGLCLHSKNLSLEYGYCDISPENAEGEFFVYLNCSWGSFKIVSDVFEPTLMDKYNIWYTNCNYVGSEYR